MWINGEQIVRYQGQTCDKCDIFFSYGIARIGVEQFAKRYPEKSLPDQIVFYSPVEYSLGDPGWIPRSDPVDDVVEQQVSPESTDLNDETHTDTESDNLPTAASTSTNATEIAETEDNDIETPTTVNDQVTSGDEASEEKVYDDVVIIVEEAEISTSTSDFSTGYPENSELKPVVNPYERTNDRR